MLSWRGRRISSHLSPTLPFTLRLLRGSALHMARLCASKLFPQRLQTIGKKNLMLDFLYIALAIGFFVVAAASVRLIERL